MWQMTPANALKDMKESGALKKVWKNRLSVTVSIHKIDNNAHFKQFTQSVTSRTKMELKCARMGQLACSMC